MSGGGALQNISSSSIDYLQRVGFEPEQLSPEARATVAPPSLRRLTQITGIGRPYKHTPSSSGDRVKVPASAALIAGLYGYKIPLAFRIRGDRGNVSVELGSWILSQSQTSQASLALNHSVLESLLSGLYSSIELSDVHMTDEPLDNYPLGGMALGIPTARPPEPGEDATAIDRLIRAMARLRWSVLILAQPMPESESARLRSGVIDEMHTAEADGRASLAAAPLIEHYTELLKASLTALTEGQTLGAWRTAVYLLGDERSYFPLASLWRSLYSGERSLPEPIHVWDDRVVTDLASYWALPDSPERRGPGDYRHPFQYQTVLTSAQLAAYVSLPEQEAPGFAITVVPEFDVVPPPSNGRPSIHLGEVLHRTVKTGTPYDLSLDSLGRHAFVTGVTGSGKSKTMTQILLGAHEQRIPFMVIEPAKAEYRALIADPALAGTLQVFTLGDERVSPFRLNPFEVPPLRGEEDDEGTTYPIAQHLDLLRSVFSAGFGMWTPLPQILERSLYRVYERYGWDLEIGTNARIGPDGDASEAFPTLSDLVGVIDEVTRSLGYDDKITSDMSASLRTRIDSLRSGGKGRMLDVRRSIPMSMLLERPTILELESMGDDDDKAFVMGLLFVRLVEHRRSLPQTKKLSHLLVIEEAHRLLTNVGAGSPEEANPRGKAVETFTNLLSEIRAYGQGVVVVDQVPARLAPDVIKNTNVKIAHRIVAEDDRRVLAGAMAMDERQAASLSTLRQRQATIFEEQADTPVLIETAEQPERSIPRPGVIHRYMSDHESLRSMKRLFRPTPSCEGTCPIEGAACLWARRGCEDPALQRAIAYFTQCLIEDPEGSFRANESWDQLAGVVNRLRPTSVGEVDAWASIAVHSAAWWAARRGSQAGWTFERTREIESALRSTILTHSRNGETTSAALSFRSLALEMLRRDFDPYTGCAKTCDRVEDTRGRCLYRHAAADVVASGRFRERWNDADKIDGSTDRRTETWRIAQEVGALEIIRVPGSDQPSARAGLCFAQQMLAADISKPPATTQGAFIALHQEAVGDNGIPASPTISLRDPFSIEA